MIFDIIRKSKLTTATWKGGTTTQLFIYPKGTEYQKFNFDFRMSYATVEIPESTFTFMPGVIRHLMILRGELELDHTNQYKKTLKKFDQDVFNGEWPTTSKGMVMDFNLMTRNGFEGKVEAMILAGNEEKLITFSVDFHYSGVFVLHGVCEIKLNKECYHLNQGDFILLERTTMEKATIRSFSTPTEVIFAHVKKAVLS